MVYAAFRGCGAEGIAFPSIIGSGYNGTTLHYDQNTCRCADGDVVVVDIGARYGYYCGDLTRTYPVNGRFNERQRGIYDLVLEAHDRVAEAIMPGVRIFDLRKIAYGVMEASDLRDHGGSLGELVERIHELAGEPFNVNSTSVEAWKAVLSGLRDRSAPTRDGSERVSDEMTPFARGLPALSADGTQMAFVANWDIYRSEYPLVDLWLTKAADDDKAVAGDTILYTFYAGNYGPSPAIDVKIVDIREATEEEVAHGHPH